MLSAFEIPLKAAAGKLSDVVLTSSADAWPTEILQEQLCHLVSSARESLLSQQHE